MRQSVDVTRLSRIALSNLEREGDGSDYAAVEAQAGDVRIETADAELDFVDERDEGACVGGWISACACVHTLCVHVAWELDFVDGCMSHLSY